MPFAFRFPFQVRAPSRPRAGPERPGRRLSGSLQDRLRKSRRGNRAPRFPTRPKSPPQPGAKDRTFEFLALLRWPIAAVPFILYGLWDAWQRRNSQRGRSFDGPVGPQMDIVFPPGWVVGTQRSFRETAFSVGPDQLNNFSENPYDSGEVPQGGSGLFSPRRLRTLRTENTGAGGNIPQEEWLEGDAGEVWEMVNANGDPIGVLFNGLSVGGLRLPSGAYRWTYNRFTIFLRDDAGFPQPFPGEPVLPQPFLLPSPPILPLRAAPGIQPQTPTVPEVAPDVPGEEVPPLREAPADAPKAPPNPGGQPRPAGSPSLPVVGPVRQPTGAPAVAAGAPAPAPRPEPQPTPKGQEFLPGGRPVPNSNPPATPAGMAQELGRIEGKLKLALDNLPGSNGPDLFGEYIRRLLEDELTRRLRGLFDQVPGGIYELNNPCPRSGDPDGGAPVVVEFGESADPFDSIRDRLDALALLLDAHKQMRQPTCPRGRAEGQPVTVLWEEG